LQVRHLGDIFFARVRRVPAQFPVPAFVGNLVGFIDDLKFSHDLAEKSKHKHAIGRQHVQYLP